jgi:hypothetical protein
LRQSFVTSGFEFNVKPGDPGISRFERRIVPVELRWALDYDRHVFAHADPRPVPGPRITDFASVALARSSPLAAGPGGRQPARRNRAGCGLRVFSAST